MIVRGVACNHFRMEDDLAIHVADHTGLVAGEELVLTLMTMALLGIGNAGNTTWSRAFLYIGCGRRLGTILAFFHVLQQNA